MGSSPQPVLREARVMISYSPCILILSFLLQWQIASTEEGCNVKTAACVPCCSDDLDPMAQCRQCDLDLFTQVAAQNKEVSSGGESFEPSLGLMLTFLGCELYS